MLMLWNMVVLLCRQRVLKKASTYFWETSGGRLVSIN